MNRRNFLENSLTTLLSTGLVISRGPLSQGMISYQNDWAQWGGPQRNFCVPELFADKPLPQPKLSWTQQIGNGHATIVAKDGFVFSLHLEGDDEVLSKWTIKSGERVWKSSFPVGYHAPISEYDGPHATPIIHNDRIIMASIDARVRAIDLSNGEMIWQRDLQADFGTTLPQSGYACSPLVWNDLVVLTGLGEAGSTETERFNPDPRLTEHQNPVPGLIAFDINTGDTKWQSKSFRSSHSSPIQIEIDKQPMLVVHGMFELVGVDPVNGNVMWSQLLRELAADNVSFTPIWDARRNQFLISHGYCDRLPVRA